MLSSSQGQGNFRGGLEASRPRPRLRTWKCVLEAKDVLEDSTSGYWKDRRLRRVLLCFYSAIFQLTSAKFQTFAYNSRTVRPIYLKFWQQFENNELYVCTKFRGNTVGRVQARSQDLEKGGGGLFWKSEKCANDLDSNFHWSWISFRRIVSESSEIQRFFAPKIRWSPKK